MKYFSMFSGIGGFELGVPKKYKCIGFSEIDKYAIQIYKKHFNHKNYGDCTKINPKELPYFDLLVGGFPCQSFSIVGKRGGFSDTRGTLFFEIARIVREKQPRLLLLENVKGLLSHDKGKTFTTIISTLDELGYDCQWQVLNSKNFGVPQNRERVFIIGHLRGTPRPKVFPIGGAGKKNNETKRIQSLSDKREISRTCLARDYKDPKLIQIRGGSQGNRVYNSRGISTTIASQAGGQGAKTGLYKTGEKIRRLTPTECERLQGFPDGWTEKGYGGNKNGFDIITAISDTQRYKCLGNAVTVNVIKSIIDKLIV